MPKAQKRQRKTYKLTAPRSKKDAHKKYLKLERPVSATSPRKTGHSRQADFSLSMREKISENWVQIKKDLTK